MLSKIMSAKGPCARYELIQPDLALVGIERRHTLEVLAGKDIAGCLARRLWSCSAGDA